MCVLTLYQATVNTSHTTTIDEVPPGAVDSNGEPVDSSFYTTFWKLQKYLQVGAAAEG